MTNLEGRLEALRALADAIAARRSELERAIVQTSKKSQRVASGEVELAILRLRAFDEVIPLLAGRAPVGTVAIMFPGNASLSNPVATIGTAFLAGNRVRARFPGGSRAWADMIEPLIASYVPDVRFEQCTGSRFLTDGAHDPEVPVIILFGDDAWATEYEQLMRRTRTTFIFEGPGKDPFLVLPDANVGVAARDAVRGAYYHAGQACTSPERFYVHDAIYDQFVEAVLDLTASEIVGEPESEATTIGPILNPHIVERIEVQLRDATARGARLLTGGQVRSALLADGTPTAYVTPTVLVDVTHEMAIMQDETFGPVIPIQRVKSAEEALGLAADSRYGLAASLYGGEHTELQRLQESHGPVFHNEIWLDYYRRHLHAPYGGRKRSGWVWTYEGERFVRREGPRTNALEFSRPLP